MNIDRVLRDVDALLADRGEELRAAVQDAFREAVSRERRRLDPALTVEVERERRQQAEELRGALEAIHTSVRPGEALDEVLKQLSRAVAVDFAAVASLDAGGSFRILVVRGAEPEGLLDAVLSGPRVEEAAEGRHPVGVSDAETEQAPLPLEGAPPLRSWVILPLLLEADVIGLLVAGRREMDAFTDDEVARAKAFAFWAAAALRRGQHIEQVRRYATLLEQVVLVDQCVFREESSETLARAILDGACRIGRYPGGLLVLQTDQGPTVAATSGEAFSGGAGKKPPPALVTKAATRLPPERLREAGQSLGLSLPAEPCYLVPLATQDAYVGCLTLLDPNGESPDDRLIEAFASRTAEAWRHASRQDGTS
jgi:hypothetical protein